MADDDDAAAVWSILGVDPTHFETLISDLMTSSNPQRSRAEHLFSLCKQTDPTTLVTKLLSNLLEEHNQAPRRALSAILLRKQLTQDGLALWNSVTECTRLRVKGGLLACVGKEMDNSIAKNMCYFISELAASVVVVDNGWPELLPFFLDCVGSQDSRLIERGLLIFAQLAQFVGDSNFWLQYDTSIADQLRDVFAECLGSADVRIAAFSASISFIQCLESGDDRDRFLDLFPGMILCFREALDGGNEAKAQEALELLIELAGTEPRFFRRHFVEVVDSMLKIAEADESCLEEGTRHLAIELVVTLAEARDRAPPAMRRDLPPFIRRLFAILIRMLSDFEDEAACHPGESSNYSVARECLDRLAIALGGDSIVAVAFEQLPAYLDARAHDWQKKLAALVALAQLTEICSKAMMNNLEQVVTMVLNSFQDPHPRVRWAAINAIWKLSTELGPGLQDEFHARVLPNLRMLLRDIEDEAAWHSAENQDEDEDAGESSNYSVARGCLDGLAIVLGGDTIRMLPDAMARGFAKLLEEPTPDDVDVRNMSAIRLHDLIGDHDRLANCTIRKVIGTLLSRVRMEDDIKVRFNVCRTLANAFILLNGVIEEWEWGDDYLTFIEEECMTGSNFLNETGLLMCVGILDQLRNGLDRHVVIEMLVEILDERIGKPPLEDSTTKLIKAVFLRRLKKEDNGWGMEGLSHMFAAVFRLLDEEAQNKAKGILLRRIERENDENVMGGLGTLIGKAFSLFGGEDGWPELIPCIVDYLEDPANASLRAGSATVLEQLLKEPLAVGTKSMLKPMLLRCAEREKDEKAKLRLYSVIAKASEVFGGINESGDIVWPGLYDFQKCLLDDKLSDAEYQALAYKLSNAEYQALVRSLDLDNILDCLRYINDLQKAKKLQT